MLALPLLVGIATSRFVPGHLLLTGAAVAAYLASATLQAWLRARCRSSYVPSIVAHGAAAALFRIPLFVLEPRLMLTAVVVVLAGAHSRTPGNAAGAHAQPRPRRPCVHAGPRRQCSPARASGGRYVGP